MLDDILNRAIELKDRVRTPEGARRFGQPIGSVIVRDPLHLSADLPHADVAMASKKPVSGTTSLYAAKSDYDGFEMFVNEPGDKFYVAQDEYGWGAWDAKDKLVAEGNTRTSVLKALDNKIKAVLKKKPGAKKTTSSRTGNKKKAEMKNGIRIPPAGAVRVKGDSYTRVGKGVDVRGEDNWVDLSGGTPEEMGIQKPYKGKRTIIKFEPGDKNYDKLRTLYTVPPAYETFWINANRDESDGDDRYDGLVFLGLDPNTGIRQPTFSTRHWQRQAVHKFGNEDSTELSHVPELLKNRNRIIKELQKDINGPDKKRREAAKALLVMAYSGIRVGGSHDKREKVSDRRYGATTLEARHVTLNQNSVTLAFIGKGNHQRFDDKGDPILNPAKNNKNIWPGKPYKVNIKDKVIVDLFREELKNKSRNDRLFQTSDSSANAYFREVQKRLKMSGKLTSHNFRHSKASLLAMGFVSKMPAPKDEKQFRARRKEVCEKVGAVINDSPSVVYQSYVMHSVWDQWLDKHPEWKDAKF